MDKVEAKTESRRGEKSRNCSARVLEDSEITDTWQVSRVCVEGGRGPDWARQQPILTGLNVEGISEDL